MQRACYNVPRAFLPIPHMKNLLLVAQIVVSVLLVISIILQSRGSGLSGVFGGGEGNVYQVRRGAERLLFVSTIVLTVLFLGIGAASFFLQR